MGPGISFDATEITPTPPSAMSGKVKASSPDSTWKPGSTAFRTSICCVMLPDASLMPTMFGTFERRATMAGSMLDDVRPGTL